ncbi:helix-turn-helix domain-containing protein [Cryptosporangium arvum]|uniref:Putative transcriptional regulator n=1 Tax=Cryptosporangium arvum DSM 44712 TaxID=927661 RepID=A0A010ZUF5_9ACTN|nr:helix-turn-helix transcriptional regulator [Cryptosporangium arvum]EXG80827.1 putative transcriptional regulator [Cryptosporangium arvum DSM 44712]
MTGTDHPTSLGALLRHHRTRAGLTQRELAHRVGYSRSTIANAETGDVRSADFYRRCDDVLAAAGTITAARAAIGTHPGPQAGAHSASQAGTHPDPRVPALEYRLAGVPPQETIEHLRRQWHLLVRTDNLFGPRAALPDVRAALRVLAALEAGGPARTARLCLSARYAITASWLYQDTGLPADATTWAGRAVERAHESGDRASLAWALHRQSRLAERDDPHRALALARAALRQGTDAQRPLAAALHVQCARVVALRGDRAGCDALLTRATLLADARESAGDGRTGYGGHCTRAWVLAARGECALLLHAPADAVRPLRTALTLLAPAYRRDRGLVLGRLVRARTLLGDAAGAQRAATECRAIGEATGSASVLALADAAGVSSAA